MKLRDILVKNGNCNIKDKNEDEDFLYLKRTWNLQEKLVSCATHKNKSQFSISILNSNEFNFEFIQKNGFKQPIVFNDKSGLDMSLPHDDNFSVNDVKRYLGSRHLVDVIDVNTHKDFKMSMKDWCNYYNKEDNDKRKELLNVISLEFSHTKLDLLVKAPKVVRQLDWIENAWPKIYKLNNSYYPKVQKYVLMSVSHCYTDFHIDMGGSSVWYHVFKGEKVFLLIPPSEKNLNLYEKWIKSGEQHAQFFADLVDECELVTLKQGHTLLLPSGWIHAVYTPKDSLVFGGNFLNSFNIEMQLKIYHMENRLKIPQRFRYPLFIDLHCHVMNRYVDSLNFNLTKYELNGLMCLYDFIKNLPHKLTSNLIISELVLDSFKNLIEAHLNDNQELALNGQSSIQDSLEISEIPMKKIKSSDNNEYISNNTLIRNNYKLRQLPRTKGSIKKRLRPLSYSNLRIERKRRVRCRECEACTRCDCNECKYCKDMKKFGGDGVSKQCCLLKQCLSPLLPLTTNCMLCNLKIDRNDSNTNTMLFECEICFQIYHSKCFWRKYIHLADIECVVNDKLPNCWTCANCIANGLVKMDTKSQESINNIEEEKKDEEYDEELIVDDNETQESSLSLMNESILSVESLSSNEKTLILNKFCEYIPREKEISLWKPIIA